MLHKDWNDAYRVGESPFKAANAAWSQDDQAGSGDRSKREHANKAGAQNGQVRALETFCAADFDGRPVPLREWLVDGIIPHKNVTLLAGDGGLGKTILGLQLGTSLSSRTTWLGLKAMQGPTLYFGAEDEIDELHRRIDQIRRELGLSWGDLADFHIKSLAGEDAVLGAVDKGTQAIRPTKLCARLEARIRELGAIACILDTSADVFGGDEISRLQVRQFVGLLRGIALRNSTAVVLLSHPSQSGLSSGSGTSGSTHWHNAVRSRLYLTGGEKTSDGEPRDPDERLMRFKKANYGPKRKPMRLLWQNGLFVPDTGEKAEGTSQLKAEATFLGLLDAYTAQNRPVGPSPSTNYAPAVFDQDKRSNKLGKGALTAAMNELLHKNEIVVETFGPPSHRRQKIVRAYRAEVL